MPNHLTKGRLKMLTIEDLHTQNLLLFEAVSGSRAYGLATPESDTDIKGVFYLPKFMFYGMEYVPQISNETNDIVYYELGRFIELLLQSNPNTLELLASPPDCVRYRSPLMDAFKTEWFVSKACRQSFAGYAYGQIKKARGLNKKISNPMSSEKKSVLNFCHIVEGAQTVPLQHWLSQRGMEQRRVGLVKIAHARELYALFYDTPTARAATTASHSNPKPPTSPSAPFPKAKPHLPTSPSTKTDTAATAANTRPTSNGWRNATKRATKARKHTDRATTPKT